MNLEPNGGSACIMPLGHYAIDFAYVLSRFFFQLGDHLQRLANNPDTAIVAGHQAVSSG